MEASVGYIACFDSSATTVWALSSFCSSMLSTGSDAAPIQILRSAPSIRLRAPRPSTDQRLTARNGIDWYSVFLLNSPWVSVRISRRSVKIR